MTRFFVRKSVVTVFWRSASPMSLEEAYDTLLEDYQEARKLNDELEEMIHEYIQVYGAL